MLPSFVTKLAMKEPSPLDRFRSAVESLPANQLAHLQEQFGRTSHTPQLDNFSEAVGPNSISLAEKTAAAEELGRQLAREMGERLYQEKIAGNLLSGALGAAKAIGAKAAPMVGQAAGALASHPGAAMAAGGAALGAAGGAVAGGPGNRMSGAMKGGLMGGAAGFGASKIPGIAPAMGKAVGNAGTALGKWSQIPKIASLLETALKHPGKSLGAVGAGLGALHGAMKTDPMTGQAGGLGGAITGGIGGGLVGGAAGGLAGHVSKLPDAYRAAMGAAEQAGVPGLKGLITPEIANQVGAAGAKGYAESPGLLALLKKKGPNVGSSFMKGPTQMGTPHPTGASGNTGHWNLSQLMPVNPEGFTR